MGSNFDIEIYKENFLKNCNALNFKIIIQASLDGVDSKLLKPWHLDQDLGTKRVLKFIIEIYM